MRSRTSARDTTFASSPLLTPLEIFFTQPLTPFVSFSLSQPKAVKGKSKPAAAPYSSGGSKTKKPAQNPLFEKKSKTFGIGEFSRRERSEFAEDAQS